MFISWVLLGIIGAFKSYPSVGDISLFLSLTPLFYHKLHGLYALQAFINMSLELEFGFILGLTWIYLMVLYPIMSFLWVTTGTGNANFYYALNITTATANLFLITDALAALRKRAFLIKKELPRPNTDRMDGLYEANKRQS